MTLYHVTIAVPVTAPVRDRAALVARIVTEQGFRVVEVREAEEREPEPRTCANCSCTCPADNEGGMTCVSWGSWCRPDESCSRWEAIT